MDAQEYLAEDVPAAALERSRVQAMREDARLAALERYDILDTPREESFDRITRLAKRIFRVPMVTVTLLDGHRQWFKSRQGLAACETPRAPAFCNVAIEREDPLVIHDAAKDPRFADNPLVTGDPHIRFYAGAPIVTPDGHALGALCVIDTVPRDFDAEQIEMLADLAHIVTDELELRLLAATDTLTGALSRRAFRDDAARALKLAARHDHPLSLVAFDLDNFKSVNDTHGHGVGDAVLARAVAAVRRELRDSDIVGRLGGEEFAVLLPHTGARAAVEVAERLRAAVAAERFRSGAAHFSVTASFGVDTRTRTTGDVDALLREADSALYLAKANGRNRCELARPADPGMMVGERRKVFKRGRILFDRRMRSRDCTVRSLSDHGAGVDVSSPIDLPETFELAIGAEDLFRLCRVVKMTESRVEVEFI